MAPKLYSRLHECCSAAERITSFTVGLNTLLPSFNAEPAWASQLLAVDPPALGTLH